MEGILNMFKRKMASIITALLILFSMRGRCAAGNQKPGLVWDLPRPGITGISVHKTVYNGKVTIEVTANNYGGSTAVGTLKACIDGNTGDSVAIEVDPYYPKTFTLTAPAELDVPLAKENTTTAEPLREKAEIIPPEGDLIGPEPREVVTHSSELDGEIWFIIVPNNPDGIPFYREVELNKELLGMDLRRPLTPNSTPSSTGTAATMVTALRTRLGFLLEETLRREAYSESS